MASSTGSGGPFASAGGGGGDSKNTTAEATRSSDARTTMEVAVLLVPAGDAAPPTLQAFPHIFLHLQVTQRNDAART
jgi:hypothetical protein